ncbi:MAG: 2-dehydropantoate 2-reductase [Campylobacterales bacterium]|nr:2-dehydropantoate 2-reductase [Campylobacterales bacterium]
MKVAIVGTGGVGGYLGAMLSTKYDVSMITKESYLKVFEKDGLTLLDGDSLIKVAPKFFTTMPKKGEKFDLIIFCTKAYDLEASAKLLKEFTTKDTILFSICNGLEYEKSLKEYFPKSFIASSCIYINSNIVKPGVIRKKGETFLLIVGQKEDNTPLLKVKELFEGAGLSVKVANDIEYECWKKYIFIVSFGALTALYNKPMGAVLKDHLSELRDLFYELKELANIYDVKIDLALIDNLIQNAQKNIPYDAATSLQLDINSGKKNELEFLVGKAVKLAKSKNFELPILEPIYQKLKEKTNMS